MELWRRLILSHYKDNIIRQFPSSVWELAENARLSLWQWTLAMAAVSQETRDPVSSGQTAEVHLVSALLSAAGHVVQMCWWTNLKNVLRIMAVRYFVLPSTLVQASIRLVMIHQLHSDCVQMHCKKTESRTIFHLLGNIWKSQRNYQRTSKLNCGNNLFFCISRRSNMTWHCRDDRVEHHSHLEWDVWDTALTHIDLANCITNWLWIVNLVIH